MHSTAAAKQRDFPTTLFGWENLYRAQTNSQRRENKVAHKTANKDPKYRWSHPTEWFAEKIAEGDESTLRGYLNALLSGLDGDTIQDAFQDEMETDGYFREESE
jgi:hypothetical protein